LTGMAFESLLVTFINFLAAVLFECLARFTGAFLMPLFRAGVILE